MEFDGRTLVHANGDYVIRARQDGRYNLEGEESTIWGVSSGELDDLIRAEEKILALNIARAAEQSYEAARASAIANRTPLVIHTNACDYAAHVASNPNIAVIVEVGEYALDSFVDWYASITGLLLDGTEPWLRLLVGHNGWEPRVRCTFTFGMSLPHPVIDAGTVGKGKKTLDGSPRFLLFHQKGIIENNYQEYFRGILQAGFRPA